MDAAAQSPPAPAHGVGTDGEAGKALLSCAAIRHALGAGSNGVVLLGTFPPEGLPSDAAGAGVPTDGRKVAIKLMSHFWDDNAKMLLDCERRTLAHLPRHPGVVDVYSQFTATIPEAFDEYLTPDMRTAAASDRAHTTQAFLFGYHPTTLDKFRSVLPLPVPWLTMWRVARDLVGVVAHMETHRTAHLDLKLDNILVAYDGRCVLTDFGISRVFTAADGTGGGGSGTGGTGGGLSLVYAEPFDLLMNKLVLAPEVLIAYDRARAAVARRKKAAEAAAERGAAGAAAAATPSTSPPAGGAAAAAAEGADAVMTDCGAATKAGTDAAVDTDDGDVSERTIDFSWQGIWSVGVVLYEVAAGYGHEPAYPEDGAGGMRGTYYALAGLPPLPVRADDASAGDAGVRSVLSRAADGSLRHTLVPVAEDDAAAAAGASQEAVATAVAAAAEAARAGKPVNAAALPRPAAACAPLPSFAGYPPEFCALLLSMLHADPAQRVSTRDALAALDAMAPVYRIGGSSSAAASAASSGGDGAAPAPPPPPPPQEGFPVRLPDGSVGLVTTDYGVLYAGEEGVYLAEADPDDNSYVPVLLRHAGTGEARLLRCHADMPLEGVLDYYAAGAPVGVHLPVLSGNSGGGFVPYSKCAGPSDDAAVKACRLFLGGCELLNRSARLEAVVTYLLHDDTTAPSYAYRDGSSGGDGGSYRHAVRPAVVLDLYPRDADVVAGSTSFLMGQLDEAARLAAAEAAAAGRPPPAGDGASEALLLVSSNAEVLPPPPPSPAGEPPAADPTTTTTTASDDDSSPSKRRRLAFEPVAVDAVSTAAAAPPAGGGGHTDTLMRWLQSYSATPAGAKPDEAAAGAEPPARRRPPTQQQHQLPLVSPPREPYDVDLREALAHRCLLGLTSVCNDALKDSSIEFPFVAAATYAVAAVAAYPGRHETVSAAIGLLRNLSCMEQPAVAVVLVASGCVEACVRGFFAPWTKPAPAAGAEAASSSDAVDGAEGAAADKSRSSRRKRGTAAAVALSNGVIHGASGAAAGTSAAPKLHGDDPRVAEDAVLTVSNLLRFDEVQALPLWTTTSAAASSSSLPAYMRAAALAASAMARHSDAHTLHDSGARLLRYLLAVHPAAPTAAGGGGASDPATPVADGADAPAAGGSAPSASNTAASSPAAAAAWLVPADTAGVACGLAAAGAVHALVPGLTTFASDQAMVELLLHVGCSLLVYEGVRSHELCPYRDAATAVVALMSRPEFADDEGVLSLGATVLRNLACVPGTAPSTSSAAAGSGEGASTTTTPPLSLESSPAVVVTQAGAATALEAAMERHPKSASIQENGRCALYNLLLLSVTDAAGIVAAAQRLADDNAALRARLEAAQKEAAAASGGPPPPVRPRTGSTAAAAPAPAPAGASGAALSPAAAVAAAPAAAAASAATGSSAALSPDRVQRGEDSWSPDVSVAVDGAAATPVSPDAPLAVAVSSPAPTDPVFAVTAPPAAPAGVLDWVTGSGGDGDAVAVTVGDPAAAASTYESRKPKGLTIQTGATAGASRSASGASDTGALASASVPAVSGGMSPRLRRQVLAAMALLLVCLLAAVGAAIAGFLT